MARKPVGAIAIKWHKILSYVGPNAIKQLPKHINSAELTKLTTKRAPLKIKCKACLLAKHIVDLLKTRTRISSHSTI